MLLDVEANEISSPENLVLLLVFLPHRYKEGFYIEKIVLTHKGHHMGRKCESDGNLEPPVLGDMNA